MPRRPDPPRSAPVRADRLLAICNNPEELRIRLAECVPERHSRKAGCCARARSRMFAMDRGATESGYSPDTAEGVTHTTHHRVPPFHHVWRGRPETSYFPSARRPLLQDAAFDHPHDRSRSVNWSRLLADRALAHHPLRDVGVRVFQRQIERRTAGKTDGRDCRNHKKTPLVPSLPY
jgi:hypothetical protein